MLQNGKVEAEKTREIRRQGKVLVLVALCLTLLLGVVACALDVGWVMMARTELQAGADASCLAGGTELLPGLGTNAYKTPEQVAAAVNLRTVEYAAKHRACDTANIYVSAGRDVQMGKAHMADGAWVFEWGSTPYNAVQVTTRRSVEGSGSGDGQLPLIIAPALGHSFSSVEAVGTAVILPSSGVHIPPGSETHSALSPFAFKQQDYDKYKRAQLYYKNVLGSNPALINPTIMDSGESPSTPLFYLQETSGNKVTYRQIFGDSKGVIDPMREDAANITSTPDGILELSIYPTVTASAGNFGTVDIGDPNNSTADIKRQIVEGPNASDLSYFPNNTIDFSTTLTLNGDTGISSGIENSIQSIIGQIRAALLFDTVTSPGNNATFTISGEMGLRIMDVTLSGSNKTLVIQPANVSDPGGLPDPGDDDTTDNSVFSRLIIAQ